jgi:adenylate cyclase
LLSSQRSLALLCAALATALMVALLNFMPNLFANLERISGDWTWRLAADSRQERRVILVDINEDSLARVGPWPWSRQTMAKLSNQLAQEGVNLQVFDIVFPEPTGQDDAFRQALLSNQAIISQVFSLTPNAKVNTAQPQFAMPRASCPLFAAPAFGHIGNAESFNGVAVGHISAGIDGAGQIRHQPAFVCHNGKTYPALFVVALAKALSQSNAPFGPDALANLAIEEGTGTGPRWWLRGLPLPGYGIPLNAQGEVRIPWWTPSKQFIAISASDILDGRVEKGLLDNAWVVVGSTALGLNDRITSPFNSVDAGLVVHAQLLKGAIDGNLPFTPAMSGLVTVVLSMSALILIRRPNRPLFSRPHRSLLNVLLTAGLLVLALFGIKFIGLQYAGLWINVVPASLFVVIFALVMGGLESLANNVQRARLFAHLASYLPKPVAEALANQDPNSQINAAKRNITAVVADIRNFSAYCESRPPEESTAVLHAFFSMATEQAEKFGGRVESFFGDAVLMVWDNDAQSIDALPPAEQLAESSRTLPATASDPDRALGAALSLLRATQALWVQSSYTVETQSPELLAPLALGIGIETGMATVGSVGLSRRRSHLVLGRAVMVASRIQEMTGELAHPILVGEGAAARISRHRIHSKGNFLLEGLVTPCHIYAYPLEDCFEITEPCR